MHVQFKILGVALFLICHSTLALTKSITFRSTTPENMDILWLDVERVFDKMAPHLEATSASVSMLITRQNQTYRQVVQFSDVIIANWLSDIFINYVTYFNTIDTRSSEDNEELQNYFPYIRFKLNEKVVVVNFTIPQLSFTGNYTLKQRNKQGRIHCAMNNLTVGLFMHFSRLDNLIYVDNFQMAPPEKSYVLVANNEPNPKLNKNKPQVAYINDKIKFESKVAVWLSTSEIIENYFKHFVLINGKLQ